MKSNQLLALLALLILTIGGYLVFKPEDSASDNLAEGPKEPLAELKVQAIRAIVITSAEAGKATSVRIEKAAGQWSVAERGGYEADSRRIEGLVKNLKAMKVLRRVSAGKNQLARLHLNPPKADQSTAVRVALLGENDEPLQLIDLGKALNAPGAEDGGSPFGGGGALPDRRFVMLDEDPSGVVVVDQTFPNATSDPVGWINSTDFFSVNDVLALAVEYSGSEATNSWELIRENTSTNWTLVDVKSGEELDPNKLSSLADPLQSPTLNDVLTGEAANLGTNLTRIILRTEDRFTYSLALGEPGASGEIPMQLTIDAVLPDKRTPVEGEKPEDKDRLDAQWLNQQRQLKIKLELERAFAADKWTYAVPGYTLSGLLMKRHELLKEKQPLGPVGPVPPAPQPAPTPPGSP